MKAFIVDLSARRWGGEEYNSHARLILAESQDVAEKNMLDACLLAYPPGEGHESHKVAVDEVPFRDVERMYDSLKAKQIEIENA